MWKSTPTKHVTNATVQTEDLHCVNSEVCDISIVENDAENIGHGRQRSSDQDMLPDLNQSCEVTQLKNMDMPSGHG